MQARGIFLIKHGDASEAFDLREYTLPPLKANEVLIRVKYSGINFADVMARKGRYDDAPALPAILGYDVSGTILHVGADVDHLSTGDRVAALTRFGGYADHVIASVDGCVKIPSGIRDESAVALTTQGATAFHAAIQSTTLYRGDKVLIHAAAGGVGSLLVQIAKSKGCYIVGTASSSKQDYIKSLGVDLPIDYTTENFVQKIEDVIGPKNMDVVFDSIGGSSFAKGLKLLGPGGRLIFYGAASMLGSGSATVLDMIKTGLGFGFRSPVGLIQDSKALIGINMLRIADAKPQVLREALSGVLQLAKDGILHPHIGGLYSYREVDKAHDELANRKTIGKLLISWE